jgi:hypothetical protein
MSEQDEQGADSTVTRDAKYLMNESDLAGNVALG